MKPYTLEQVLALPDGTRVWVEIETPVQNARSGLYRMRNRQLVGIETSAHIQVRIGGYYGISYRCWTSRPTDPEKEAEPWGR